MQPQRPGPRTRTRSRSPVPILCLLAAAGLIASSGAIARVVVNTIDAIAVLAANGRQLTVTGPIEVTAGETVFLHVTVTQRTTGAIAEGVALVTGTGAPQQWTVRATTQTRESFEEGAATAVGLARTTTRGEATDAHQWLVPVTLVRN